MLSEAIPLLSAKATPACSTRSLLRGFRGFVAVLGGGAISVSPLLSCRGLDNLTS